MSYDDYAPAICPCRGCTVAYRQGIEASVRAVEAFSRRPGVILPAESHRASAWLTGVVSSIRGLVEK